MESFYLQYTKKMVKIHYFVLFMWISMTKGLSQTANKFIPSIDTSECNRLYRERYEKGKENLLVTYWESPPIMEKTTIEYADSICQQIDASAYEGRYLVVMILVGENGAPYCSSIWEAGKGLKNEDKQHILYYSNFIRFVPATLRKRPVESVYLFTPRKDKKSGRWHCPEMMNE